MGTRGSVFLNTKNSMGWAVSISAHHATHPNPRALFKKRWSRPVSFARGGYIGWASLNRVGWGLGHHSLFRRHLRHASASREIASKRSGVEDFSKACPTRSAGTTSWTDLSLLPFGMSAPSTLASSISSHPIKASLHDCSTCEGTATPSPGCLGPPSPQRRAA